MGTVGKSLYDRDRAVYDLLRCAVKVKLNAAPLAHESWAY